MFSNLLQVSHDEHLISGSVDQLWVVSEGRVNPFNGTFQDYKKILQSKQKNCGNREAENSFVMRVLGRNRKMYYFYLQTLKSLYIHTYIVTTYYRICLINCEKMKVRYFHIFCIHHFHWWYGNACKLNSCLFLPKCEGCLNLFLKIYFIYELFI